MTRELAQTIVDSLEAKNGPVLTLLEAMMMTKLPSDGIDVYSIHKGDVTFLARVTGGGYVVTIKTIAW